MSRYRYKLTTYWHDTTGYYLRSETKIPCTVIAENNEEAKEKALKLRDGEEKPSSDYKMFCDIISADEIDEHLTDKETND